MTNSVSSAVRASGDLPGVTSGSIARPSLERPDGSGTLTHFSLMPVANATPPRFAEFSPIVLERSDRSTDDGDVRKWLA